MSQPNRSEGAAAGDKRALLVTFKPDKLPSTEELRAQFKTSYPVFRGMDSVEYKCWWVDQDRGEWGAMYVFRSAGALDDYLASDLWRNKVPAKYGCRPTWRIAEVGLILSKAMITEPDDA